MQMPRLLSSRMRREVVPQAKHVRRWSLHLFSRPIWRSSTAPANSPTRERHGASADNECPPAEFLAATLLYECELRDSVLCEARQFLAALEADPQTDELTLVMARQEVFMRRRSIRLTLMS